MVVEWLEKGGHVDALDDENKHGLLHAAANGGHLCVAKELLKRGASVDLRGAKDRTALCHDAETAEGQQAMVRLDTTALTLAAALGEQAMVRLLLEHKASIDLQDAQGVSALVRAVCEGQPECVQELLEAGASTELRYPGGFTALELAEDEGHDAIAKLIRQHVAAPSTTVAAPTLSLSGHRVRISGLQARPELNGRCGVAGRYNVAKGRYEVTVEGEAEAVLLKPASLQDMRQASANAPSAVPAARPPGEQVPTTRDGTLCEPTPAPRDVWVAAQSGDLQQVIEWLHMGGHVDARAEDGRGLLHFAAYSGQLRVAEELLQRGANVDLCGTKGTTALMVVASLGKHAMVRLLLEHKAGIDLRIASGATALMMAAGEGHTECMQELLEAGASTELRSQNGYTALQVAEAHDRAATAKLLKQHAAKHSAASPKAEVIAKARAVAEAAAERAATELRAEEGANETPRAKKKKKKKGGGAASAASTTATLDPKLPTVLPSAAEPAVAAPTPSARELAMAALQQAIDAGELEPIRKAISTHATAADGTDVLKEARMLRDRLAEQQREVTKEAKLGG